MKTKRVSKAVALALVAGSVSTLVQGNIYQTPSARLQPNANPSHQPTASLPTAQNTTAAWVLTNTEAVARAR
ncbi:MAG TPA: hypothetical protein PK239_10435 [Chitinophagales bacterium]|nr:hypothetical protein [Chitinophagales bacterium]HRK27693.1 hypothetical protein [Chitinophagales bacterium]